MGKIINLDRVVINIWGPDAQKLLHDTLTCNLSKPLGDQARWFALLAPQGKILVEGLIISQGENQFSLDVPKSSADDFLKRMRLYKMRADVTIERDEARGVGWQSDVGEGVYQDSRPGMGYRRYAAIESTWENDQSTYHDARIAAGIMEMGEDFQTNQLFPHDIGMDQLKGVDFNKGCYVGQEVVSRMQHRGTARKRPVLVKNAPEANLDIIAGDKTAGTLLSAANGQGIGLVRLDKIENRTHCMAGEAAIELAVPPWAGYDFSDSI